MLHRFGIYALFMGGLVASGCGSDDGVNTDKQTEQSGQMRTGRAITDEIDTG